MTPTTDDVSQPIIIVGSGPVGLTLSLELSRHGVPHLLLGKETTTAKHPKANAIGSRSMEHFRRLGLSKTVRSRGLPDDYPTDIAYLTRLNGFEIARFRMPSRAEVFRAAELGDDLGWPSPEHPHRISQILLEEILLDAATSSQSADIRLGWQVTSVKEHADFVAVDACDLTTGDSHLFHTRWLVGADGARSTIRDAIGVRFEGDRVKRSFLGGSTLAVYFESAELQHILAGREALLYQALNPEMRSGGFSINGRDRFVFHFQAPEGTNAETLDERPLLATVAGRDFDYTLLSRVTWNAGLALVAQRLSTPRIFLAGDAAHLFTPTGGFGLNTGIDEAANLGWKLAAVEQGWGDPALLDTYAVERRPIAVRNVRAASRIADLLVTFDVSPQIEDVGYAGEHARAEAGAKIIAAVTQEAMTKGIQLGVSYESAAIVTDGTPVPPDSPTEYVPTARPGSRLPHVNVADGPIYDQLGTGFTLLCIAVDDDGAVGDTELRGVGAPLVVRQFDDNALAEFYDAHYVLVRPDQHVAWRSRTKPTDLAPILQIACGAGQVASQAASVDAPETSVALTPPDATDTVANELS